MKAVQCVHKNAHNTMHTRPASSVNPSDLYLIIVLCQTVVPKPHSYSHSHRSIKEQRHTIANGKKKKRQKKNSTHTSNCHVILFCSYVSIFRWWPTCLVCQANVKYTSIHYYRTHNAPKKQTNQKNGHDFAYSIQSNMKKKSNL